MLLQTIVEKIKYKNKIDYNSKIFMIGSCFVSNIGKKLENRKFDILTNPLGTIYNPYSVVDTLNICQKKQFVKENNIFEQGGVFGSFSANTLFSDSNKNKVLTSINNAINNAHNFIEESNFIIITLGSAHCYFRKDNGSVVANCHKFKSSFFEKRLIEYPQIVENFSALLDSEFYRSKNIIFTISPVRYAKDGFIDNNISKSHLLLAVNELTKRYSNVTYFPAYEIFNDELRDYRFYADDMLHPSELGVEYVWNIFLQQLIDFKAQNIIKEVEEIQRRLNHRPYNPDSDEYKKFVLQTLEIINKLENNEPILNFEQEKEKLCVYL